MSPGKKKRKKTTATETSQDSRRQTEARTEAEAAAADPAAGERPAAAGAETAEPEWRDRALRAHAEMQNMRKRLESEVEERTRMRMEALFQELITLNDHLELALAALPDELEQNQAAAGFLAGIKAIAASFDDLLRRFGLEAIQPADDQEFDPDRHEAVQTEEREGLEAPRLELVRRGYQIGRRILRPAQVRVLRPAEPAAPEQE
ncbi:MAG: nucleotide exchange factor GrpE [Planctomycetota bacterium]|nr:MAG: nucleotide exchange factor GrpE [Planctomycetota bacterium]